MIVSWRKKTSWISTMKATEAERQAVTEIIEVRDHRGGGPTACALEAVARCIWMLRRSRRRSSFFGNSTSRSNCGSTRTARAAPPTAADEADLDAVIHPSGRAGGKKQS
ncbi:hypothetical protein PLESTF_001307200 [Pleodorina starrii]|nr:hypothetical protein PLESTM_000505600 [Pleodorina starrii]GLC72896.1 hypothetical protein PLESTF_001307200 [Pleodorina starrii]